MLRGGTGRRGAGSGPPHDRWERQEWGAGRRVGDCERAERTAPWIVAGGRGTPCDGLGIVEGRQGWNAGLLRVGSGHGPRGKNAP